LHQLVNRLKGRVHGSSFLVHGSWFLVHRSWFMVPGSWFRDLTMESDSQSKNSHVKNGVTLGTPSVA
jgi:hypothetical protein